MAHEWQLRRDRPRRQIGDVISGCDDRSVAFGGEQKGEVTSHA
jgi:hypothetical protein